MSILTKYLKEKFLKTQDSGVLPAPFYSENFAVDLGDFTTSGDAVWTRVTDEGNGDLFSARSGVIGNCQVSILQLVKNTTQESTLLQYDYKTSTEQNFDYLHIKVNGLIVARHSGTNAWTTGQVWIHGIGSQTIQFVYYKDTSSIGGTDQVWVDNVGLYNFEESAISETQTIFRKSLTALQNLVVKGYATFNGLSLNGDFEIFNANGYRLSRMTSRTNGTVYNQFYPNQPTFGIEVGTLTNKTYYLIKNPIDNLTKIDIGVFYEGDLQHGYLQTAAGGFVRIGEAAGGDLTKILTVNGDSLFRGTIAKAGGTAQQHLMADGSTTIRPKVYTALISQAGTSAPTAVILENTLGATITWTRDAAGDYTATLSSSLFLANKVVCFATKGIGAIGFPRVFRNSDTVVKLQNYNAAGSAVDSLTDLGLEIRIYP